MDLDSDDLLDLDSDDVLDLDSDDVLDFYVDKMEKYFDFLKMTYASDELDLGNVMSGLEIVVDEVNKKSFYMLDSLTDCDRALFSWHLYNF